MGVRHGALEGVVTGAGHAAVSCRGLSDVRGALRGKRVLVTGHTGFKGSWLVIWLHRLGAKVVGYGLPAAAEIANYHASRVADLLEQEHLADIRDLERLRRVWAAFSPQLVFHLAAQSLVLEGYRSPRETFDVNVMGTINVLEVARMSGAECSLVVVTSDKCYREHADGLPCVESDAMGGRDPYSASKGAAELAVAAYRQAYFDTAVDGSEAVHLATVRAGNVIGGGDWAEDRLVPDCARAHFSGEVFSVRYPAAVRPWQHVLDPLWGYLLLAANMVVDVNARWCRGWNFGPEADQHRTVDELLARIRSEWSTEGARDSPAQRVVHENANLRLSSELALRCLGWRSTCDFSKTVSKTARWYQAAHLDRGSSRALCLHDITEFEKDVTHGRGRGEGDNDVGAERTSGSRLPRLR